MRDTRSSLVRALLCVALAVLSTACAANRVKSDAATQAARVVIDNYFAALNRRDLLALTAYVTPDFQWISVANGARFVEVESREALAETLRRHFERHDYFRWSAASVDALGSVVTVTERSEWREAGALQSRTTLGVFELHDGRIRRVTYFLVE